MSTKIEVSTVDEERARLHRGICERVAHAIEQLAADTQPAGDFGARLINDPHEQVRKVMKEIAAQVRRGLFSLEERELVYNVIATYEQTCAGVVNNEEQSEEQKDVASQRRRICLSVMNKLAG